MKIFSKMKNAVIETQISLSGLNITLDTAEEIFMNWKIELRKLPRMQPAKRKK